MSILLVLACFGRATVVDTADTFDTSDSEGCEGISVLLSSPTSGESDVSPSREVTATFNTRPPSATISLTADGTPVFGQSRWRDETTLVFTPDAPLRPGIEHEATVDWCGGHGVWSFVTAGVGEPTDPSTLAGKVYEVDFRKGEFVQPEGIGELLAAYIEASSLLAIETADSSIDMLGGAAVPERADQDPCAPTIDFVPSDFSLNPYFSVGPIDGTILMSGLVVPVQDVQVDGTLSVNQKRLEGLTVSATMDTRPLVPLLDSGGSDSAICDIAASTGVTCVPCPDGERLCLDFYVDGIDAPLVPDGVVVPVSDVCE